jgi:hypothetical protein
MEHNVMYHYPQMYNKPAFNPTKLGMHPSSLSLTPDNSWSKPKKMKQLAESPMPKVAFAVFIHFAKELHCIN